MLWPLAAQAQERVRRVGVLISGVSDPETQGRHRAFLEAMELLGWIDGRNLRIDARWAKGSIDGANKYAVELVALAPDVVMVTGSAAAGAMLATTNTVPVVFTQVPDPVGAGYVESMARPGGNATGFMPFEFGIGGKWLELLKEIAPHVTRAGIVRDPTISAGLGQWGAIQAVAPSLGLDLTAINLRDPAEIGRSIAAFSRIAGGGLIVTASARAQIHRDMIIELAARHKLPAVYNEKNFAVHGGLLAYGASVADQNRRAATYVDRILRGESAANLPVQAPTKYELAVNVRAAKAIEITIPQTLLARADEVVE